MDIDSARYLLSAIIQATATAWTLLIAVHIFAFGFRVKSLEGKNESKGIFGFLFDLQKIFSRMELWSAFVTFVIVTCLAISTIFLGVVALMSFEGTTYTESYVDLTVALFVLTFLFLGGLAVFEFYVFVAEKTDKSQNASGYKK